MNAKMRTASQWPMMVKPALMGLPRPIRKRFIDPLWRRWYLGWARLPLWGQGSYDDGDVAYWRSVRLVCGRGHFVGANAVHPWDPGWGWDEAKAATLWTPAGRFNAALLALVGDRRIRGAPTHFPPTKEPR